VKLLILTALTVSSFFLPNSVITAFIVLSQIIAGVFLVVQVMYMIDFAYSWNESWLEKQWEKGILFTAVLMYGTAIAAVVLLFTNFAVSYPNNEPPIMCDFEKSMISLTIISTFIVTVYSSTEMCEHGAILPSGVMTVYAYWVLYGALADNPDQSCMSPNMQMSLDSDNDYSVIFSFVLATLSIVYAGWNISKRSTEGDESFLEERKKKREAGDDASDVENDDDADNATKTESIELEVEDDNEENNTGERDAGCCPAYGATKFHFAMAACVCYGAMLLTDWGTQADTNHSSATLMGIKIATQWVCTLLYGWSLIAPKVLTGREF